MRNYLIRTLALVLGLLSAAVSPAVAQQYNTLPPNSIVANVTNRSNPANALAISDFITVLNLFSLTKKGDVDFTISLADRVVATDRNNPFTGPHTWTLPRASAVAAGQPLYVTDLGSTVTLTNTLTISRAGATADTINGGIAPLVINSPNSAYILISDGSSNWLAQALSMTIGSVSSIAGNVGAFTLGPGLTNSVNDIRVSLPALTTSLGADVALNNTSNYFDGPSVGQGTSGTWWAAGTVTIKDTAGIAQIMCKLWDGTTVIASADGTVPSTSTYVAISLHGYLASPAGNIRISCKDVTSTSGAFVFNQTGNSKDSTITVHRIQ